ncbi:MAG: hypothetical protein CSA11_03750 [Chloroflexi bacterium]|nr:MAG: hypothetical protein CSA11_03750 [Chloroflexota bacterium]
MSDAKKSYLEGLHTIKVLTGINQSDFDTLKEAAPEATQWVDDVVQFFYNTLFDHFRTAAVFDQGERLMREQTLRDWYLSLFTTANDDDTFWNTQSRIGFAHIRRHVNNEFMIGIASRLSEFFTAKSVEAYGVERGLMVTQAFNRVLRTVVGLTAEGYDVMSQLAFSEATGAGAELIDRLVQESVDDIQSELD